MHLHREGLLVLVCEAGLHLEVTMATVIRTTGLLDMNLTDEEMLQGLHLTWVLIRTGSVLTGSRWIMFSMAS